MAEYINRADVWEIIKKGHNIYKNIKLIRELPTIDIVRCEVCKYWSLEKELTKLNGERYTVGYCCLEDKYSDCNWFCADGERKPALKHADKETLQSAT